MYHTYKLFLLLSYFISGSIYTIDPLFKRVFTKIVMDKKQIIVVGGGGHAKCVAAVLLRLPQYEVIGFLDDSKDQTSLLGMPKLGRINPVEKNLTTKYLALGVGHVGKTEVRNAIIGSYEKAGYSFETIIAPTVLSNFVAHIGKGVYIADGVILQPDVVINDYAIISNIACINHDCRVGRNTHICPGVMISGNVTIGEDSLLGTGSSVVHGVSIGSNCIVAAGQTVIKNLHDNENLSAFNLAK